MSETQVQHTSLPTSVKLYYPLVRQQLSAFDAAGLGVILNLQQSEWEHPNCHALRFCTLYQHTQWLQFLEASMPGGPYAAIFYMRQQISGYSFYAIDEVLVEAGDQLWGLKLYGETANWVHPVLTIYPMGSVTREQAMSHFMHHRLGLERPIHVEHSEYYGSVAPDGLINPSQEQKRSGIVSPYLVESVRSTVKGEEWQSLMKPGGNVMHTGDVISQFTAWILQVATAVAPTHDMLFDRYVSEG